MRILPDEQDRKLRRKVRDDYGLIGDPEENWEPIKLGNTFSVSYHERPEDDVEEIYEIAAENSEKVLILAYKGGQYVPASAKLFREDYDGKIFEIYSEDEFREAYNGLIVQYFIPENLSWIILVDHDGNLYFSGEIKDSAREVFGGD